MSVRGVLRKLMCIIMVAAISGCASTTVIHTIPEGARVFVDGEEIGETPLSYSDKRIAGTSVELQFLKKGYEPVTYTLTRDEEFNMGACLGGAFLIVPFIWILDYKAEHHYELSPRAQPLTEMYFPDAKSKSEKSNKKPTRKQKFD